MSQDQARNNAIFDTAGYSISTADYPTVESGGSVLCGVIYQFLNCLPGSEWPWSIGSRVVAKDNAGNLLANRFLEQGRVGASLS